MTLAEPGDNAAATIGELVERGECDEILLSMAARAPRALAPSPLPKRVQALDIPVTLIPPDPTGWSYSHGFPPEWIRPEAGPLT